MAQMFVPHRLRLAMAGSWRAFVSVLIVCGPAAADEPAAAVSSTFSDFEPWRVQATVYGWLMSMSGSATVKGQTVDLDASFVQLVQKSDSLVAYMGYFEANKGRVGIYADLVLAKLNFTDTMLNYRNPIDGLKISTTATTAATYSLAIIESGGLYELRRWPGSEGSSTALDALVGFRIWNQSLDVNLDALGTVDFGRLGFQRGFGFSTAGTGSLTWVDPLIGLRLRHQLTPAQRIMVRGDIGGFGLQSTISWQATAVYSYAWQFTGYQLVAGIGYRALGVNYSTGSGNAINAIDLVLHGPLIGAAIRF
jgi:hypothetical protein